MVLSLDEINRSLEMGKIFDHDNSTPCQPLSLTAENTGSGILNKKRLTWGFHFCQARAIYLGGVEARDAGVYLVAFIFCVWVCIIRVTQAKAQTTDDSIGPATSITYSILARRCCKTISLCINNLKLHRQSQSPRLQVKISRILIK